MTRAERSLEAGAYKYKIDLENKISEEPIIDAVLKLVLEMPIAPWIIKRREMPPYRMCEYASLSALASHIQPRELQISTVDELTRFENDLDEQIKSIYEVLNFSTDQKTAYCGLSYQNTIYTQRKRYYLMEKEGLASVSELEITLETRYEYNQFNRIYIKAYINGVLAEENSRLAKSMIEYWKKNNLLIINNVILEKGKRAVYAKGSIKAAAAEALMAEHERDGETIFDSNIILNYALKEKIGKANLRELKEKFLEISRNALPIKLVNEE